MRKDPAHLWLFRLVQQGAFVLLMGGIYAAAFGQRVGAYIMLAGLVITIACHLVIGFIGYRETMTRPWPKVRPIDESDDEW